MTELSRDQVSDIKWLLVEVRARLLDTDERDPDRPEAERWAERANELWNHLHTEGPRT